MEAIGEDDESFERINNRDFLEKSNAAFQRYRKGIHKAQVFRKQDPERNRRKF